MRRPPSTEAVGASRRAHIASRVGLVVLALGALWLCAVWWVAAALLSSSHESACHADTAADVAFYSVYGGIGLALVALVGGAAGALPLGCSALAMYAGVMAGACLVFATCR